MPMRNFKLMAAGACIALSLVACGTQKTTASQFASALSANTYSLNNASAAFEKGRAGVISHGPGYQAQLEHGVDMLVKACSDILNELNTLGTPEEEISALVASTKDAMTSCQSMETEKDVVQLTLGFSDARRILERWAPYGVPQE